MPCRSDHMLPNKREIEFSKITAFLEEIIEGKKPTSHILEGHHPLVYNKHHTQEQIDKHTAKLCSLLQDIENSDTESLTEYSLHLQLWWSDHKAWDARNAEKEKRIAKEKEDRKSLIASMSDYSLKLLGIKRD